MTGSAVVMSCLAVVGDRWLNATADGGARRLNNPRDFVRIEIVTALERDIPVIPVLVGRVTMPSEDELPEGLKELAYRNAVEVRSGRDFDNDVGRMIVGIEKLPNMRAVKPVQVPSPKSPSVSNTATNSD